MRDRGNLQNHGHNPPRQVGLAFDHIHCQPAPGSFLVLGFHIRAGVAHGLDDLVERYKVGSIPAQGHARGIDGLHGSHGVAFNTGHLHQPTDRVTGETEIMLHGDLCRILDLPGCTAIHFSQCPGSHRTGRTHFTLATDFCT